MDSTVLTNQFNQFKNKVIEDIRIQVKDLNANSIIFTNTFFYIQPNNPDQIYSIYGIENETLLIDTAFQGFTTFHLQDLNFECLLFIKTELEYYEKNRIVNQNFKEIS